MEQVETVILKKTNTANSFLEKMKQQLSNIIGTGQKNKDHRKNTKKNGYIDKKEVKIAVLQKDIPPDKQEKRAFIRKYKNLP